MAILIPVVTTALSPMVSVLPPSLSVGTPTITYNQLLNSLGSYDYGVSYFYMHATTFKQINQPFYYNHFDAAGNAMSQFLPFTVDPYQQLPAIYYDTNPEETIFDGFSSIAFKLYAHEVVYFKMYCDVVYMAGDLNKFGVGNMQALEEAEGVDIFGDYCNYIID